MPNRFTHALRRLSPIAVACLFLVPAFLTIPAATTAEAAVANGTVASYSRSSRMLSLRDGRKFTISRRVSTAGLRSGRRVRLYYRRRAGVRTVTGLRIKSRRRYRGSHRRKRRRGSH